MMRITQCNPSGGLFKGYRSKGVHGIDIYCLKNRLRAGEDDSRIARDVGLEVWLISPPWKSEAELRRNSRQDEDHSNVQCTAPAASTGGAREGWLAWSRRVSMMTTSAACSRTNWDNPKRKSLTVRALAIFLCGVGDALQRQFLRVEIPRIPLGLGIRHARLPPRRIL